MESDSTRATTLLGSFLRGRPRQSSQSFVDGSVLRRRRSVGNNSANHQAQTEASPDRVLSPIMNSESHRIRLVPHFDTRRSLRFDPIARDLRQGDPPLRIGRFTDHSGLGIAAINALNSNKLAFRSKVVSRVHAEIWVADGPKFFIRDTKSSSGTFLNHVRLSPANAESRPFQIRDGDILQLGVDYQGGAEDIYKSVKIRVEIGREWQASANAFNTNALRSLKALAAPDFVNPAPPAKIKALGIPDCCICLFSVTIRQALFIAPCSHTFHYKCLRPILQAHHPSFTCPICRTYADLDEDVELDDDHLQPDTTRPETDQPAQLDPAVESVLNAVGAVSGLVGGVLDLDDDPMDIDTHGRGDVTGGAITPNQGLEDADSVIVHQQGTHVDNANTPNHNPYASNASLGGVGVNAAWGSPGAGSSGSARGDSPMSMGHQQQQQVVHTAAVVGGDAGGAGAGAGAGGAGDSGEMELGEVDEIESGSGKRKR